ncbi:MAG: DNA mismatch repair endonuclease MutL, partial [bacterium]|nr:DNA mismatch repair endonuclease MutL [bacterium]
RTVLDCPPQEGPAERLRRIFRYQDALISLDAGAEAEDTAAQGVQEGMRVEGYLLLPEKTPASTARLRLFVNQRAVQDNMLRYAVRDALQGHLMRGYQPAGMLHLSLPPAEVDVNVHPAKREIRFRNSEAVRRLVAATVTAALKRQEQNLRASIFTQAGAETGRAGQGQTARTQQPQPQLERQQPVQAALNAALNSAEPPPARSSFASGQEEATGAALAALHVREAGEVAGAESWAGTTVSASVSSEPIEQVAAGEGLATDEEQFAGLRLIGQLFSLYLLCERQGRLVVIDQHAAHERILYGRMVQNYLSGKAPGQNLLFPETIELEPSLHEVLEARQAEVEAMGFGLSFFGDSTWVIQQVPALAVGLAAEAALREVLQTLRSAPLVKDAPAADTPSGHLTPAMEQVFAGLACKAAIKAGNRLEPREMLDLLAQMEAGAVFSRCPHGRPVLKIFTVAEIERWFHRHGG